MIEISTQHFVVVWQTKWGASQQPTLTNFGFFEAESEEAALAAAAEKWAVHPSCLSVHTQAEIGTAFYSHLEGRDE